MIYDLRIYTFLPGQQRAWLNMYEQNAYPIQIRHLGTPVVFMVSEVGPLNQAIHLWAYEDLADYERRRTAMQEDPEWQAYVKMSAEAGHTQQQESRILRSAPFSPSNK